MGAKDSKPCCITYEEAAKRVSEAELKRLRDAFKRALALNGCITKQAFIKEVLGEGVPSSLAEYIFHACGGTQKGISFKDLLCGLVLWTRSNKEEQFRFIFGLYASENGSYIVKNEMLTLVQKSEGQCIPKPVHLLFCQHDRVSYEEFRDWLLQYPDATSVTRWLLGEPCTVSLSNDLETPTFYQTLAGVTHLEEADIIELEKRYWMLKGQSRTGKFDMETLIPLICPPVPCSLCQGVFSAFDENRDNHIDFKEMACGISAACRGPITERQKFCFKIFDMDQDGMLCRTELEQMVKALLYIRLENKSTEELQADPLGLIDVETLVENIIRQHGSEKNAGISLEEYLVWTVGNPLPLDFLSVLFQVCHIALGLRIASKEEEGDIVRGWLEREQRRGFQLGQYWYLISMDWWKSWNEYVSCQGHASDSPVSTANSSPAVSQCGSLKYSRMQKKSSLATLEGSIALDTSAVTVTGFSNFYQDSRDGGDCDVVQNSLKQASPKKASTNSLSVLGQDSSRPSSCTPSPSHSPRLGRKLGNSVINSVGPPSRPGPVDNSTLVCLPLYKAVSLTYEGGRLTRNVLLMKGRDFELVPEALWKALSQWYGGSPALPRQVILPKTSDQVELELYPLSLRLLCHQNQQNRTTQATWSGMVGGYGATTLSSSGYAYVPSLTAPPKRYLAYLAAFSRMATVRQVYDFLVMRLRIRQEDMRLWHFKDENNMILLEEEEMTLEDLGIQDDDQILIEVRNKDQTWPEEMRSLATQMQEKRKQVPTEKGASGLNNLGNTCFMNAALQCVSNTQLLTDYFTSNMHLYELNRTNPLGMKGHIAKRYGDLTQDIWSGTAKTIAPLKLRWTIGKYAPRFNGFQQNDSQELLAFLLDGLHEDLNRVHDKPYVELKDSDGRADVIVAQEAWENHILRNKSIIVDLFHGQLKSKVTCTVCAHESVRFDPFNYLSLPLPVESYIHVEVIVIRLDGSIPVKYGLRLNMDEKYRSLKIHLSYPSGIPAEQMILVEVSGAQIKGFLLNDQKIKNLASGSLYAYELPPVLEKFSCQEKAIKITKELQTFTQIQRSTHTVKSGCRNYTAVSNGISKVVDNEENDSSINSNPGEPISTTDTAAEGTTIVCPPVLTEAGMSEERQNSMSHGDWDINHQKFCNSMSASNSPSPCSLQSLRSGASNGAYTGPLQQGYVIAFHRKMIRQDVYFLSSQKTKPNLFGLPLIIPCSEMTTHQDLYQSVWTQVSRLVSPLPPSEAAALNHAQDCDDSLGYEFPFVLKAVQHDGCLCAWCPWYRFCRGCSIQCCDADFSFSCNYLAIDWDPTALHLRYQTSQERFFLEHESVDRTRRQHSEPIDLYYCLEAFTKEEQLGEDEKYYCPKCKEHQVARKKLQIWRLPPILIVHLKRFQFVNGKWIKSQKIVKFPTISFDPTEYLAAVPKETVLLHQKLKSKQRLESSQSAAGSGKSKTSLVQTNLDPCRSEFSESHLSLAGEVSELSNRLHQKAKINQSDECTSESNSGVCTSGLAPEQYNVKSVEPVMCSLETEVLNNVNSSISSAVTVQSAQTPNKTAVSSAVIGLHKIPNGDISHVEAKVHGISGCSRERVSSLLKDQASSISREQTYSSLHGRPGRERVESTSLLTHPVNDDNLQDFHQHRLKEGCDPLDLKYHLYAMACHTGTLGGGHYISYARNPNQKWYCYNDSSCKEAQESQIDYDSAYMLFYEREGISCAQYMPSINGKIPDTRELDDEFETDFKKLCSVQ